MRRAKVLVAILGLLVVSGCGSVPTAHQPGDQVASGVRSPSPSARPSTSSQWQTYSDPDYHFSISYPPGFTFVRNNGALGSDLVISYRAVETTYLNSYPPGDLSIAIYTKDADSLTAWVTKHTGPVDSPDHMRYWFSVSNQAVTTVAGKQALSFDWVPEGGSPTFHDTTIFLGASYVLTIAWWSSVPGYATTLRQYYARMIGDLQAS